jgi:hypothetical protein
MPKQPNGTHGKKPPAPSVKVSLHKLGIAEVDTAPMGTFAVPSIHVNREYCIDHPAHGDYTYNDKWIELLVAERGGSTITTAD